MYTNLLPSFSKRRMEYPARTNSIAYLSIPQVRRKLTVHTLDRFTTYHSQVLVLGVSSGVGLNSSIRTLTTYRIRKADHKNIIIQF